MVATSCWFESGQGHHFIVRRRSRLFAVGQKLKELRAFVRRPGSQPYRAICWYSRGLLVSLLVSHEVHRDDTNMLNDTRVRNAKPADRPIKLSDSGGLHLLIQPNGSKLWRLAYRFGGKQKTLAIGVYPTVTLKHAREKRDEAKIGRASCRERV